MRKAVLFIALNIIGSVCLAQNPEQTSLKALLNHVVGGTWVSTNNNNEGKPEDYKTFFMRFNNWSDDASVTGSIFGVKNNGDTTQLIEIWNFIDQSNNTIFYVQRTTWGWHATGRISRFEQKHIDIQFKTRTEQGKEFYTRDLHYIESKNKMRAISYHKAKAEDEWKEANRSEWTRLE